MKHRFTRGVAVIVLMLAGGAKAAAPAAAPTNNKPKGTRQVPAVDVKWTAIPINAEISPIMGDPTKGQHFTYVKFKAGVKTPKHTHSHFYYGVVLAGNMKHFEPGKPETEKVLSIGSNWAVEGGVEHVTECLPGFDCISVIYQDEAFDFHPVK